MINEFEYARLALDTLMNKFTVDTLPPVNGFHYHQGVFLRGMEEFWRICREEKYYQYIKEWVDLFVSAEGELHNANLEVFDDLQPLNLVFGLYESSGEEKYKKVLDRVMPNFLTWKTNSKGGFYHKSYNPNQLWLDTLYMAGPLGVHYGAFSGRKEFIDIIFLQFELIWENMRDARSGLLYHAWDESRKMFWADTKTGLASCFWGRSVGWVPAAIVDILDYIPLDYPKRKEMIAALNELLTAVCEYQDKETGLWYQVINRGNDEKNWLETSCSCLFAYAMAKGVRKGYMPELYINNARRAYEGVLKHTRLENNLLFLDDICIGTGVMNYEGYLQRPTSTNDLHGVGAFVLMCCEIWECLKTHE